MRLCSKVCWGQTLRGHCQCDQPESNQKVESERNGGPNLKDTVRKVRRNKLKMGRTNGLTQKQSVLIGSRYAVISQRENITVTVTY